MKPQKLDVHKLHGQSPESQHLIARVIYEGQINIKKHKFRYLCTARMLLSCLSGSDESRQWNTPQARNNTPTSGAEILKLARLASIS